MKNKFLKVIGLFYLIFMVSGCEDDFETQEETFQVEPKFKISNVDSKDLENNLELKDDINAIRERNRNLSNVGNKNLYSSQHNFIIATDYGKYIENQDGSYHSYTFPIIDNDSLYTKNLLMSLNDSQSYDSYIISYDIGVMDLLNIGDNNLENAVSIEPIQLDINQSEVFNKQTIDRVCLSIVTGSSCSADIHDGGYFPNGQPCNGYTIDEDYVCYDLGGGSVPGGGGIDTGGGQDNSSPGDSGNQNNNPNNQTGLGGSGVGNVTIHIQDCGGQKCSDVLIYTNLKCDDLVNLMNKPIANQSSPKSVKDNLNHIKNNFNQNKEMAFALYPANVNATEYTEQFEQGIAGQDHIDITFGTNLVIFMHGHYDASKHLPVFSLKDIYAIYKLLDAGNIALPSTFTSIVVTENSSYALTIDDAQQFLNWGNTFFFGWDLPQLASDIFIEGGEEDYDKYVKEKFNDDKNENSLAKFISDNNIGLKLFKASSDFTSWSEVTPGNNNSATITPCP